MTSRPQSAAAPIDPQDSGIDWGEVLKAVDGKTRGLPARG
jgi:hypothetical protein